MRLIVGSLLAMLLAGCGGSDDDGSEITELRVVNLVTDSSTIAIELDNEFTYAASFQDASAFFEVEGDFSADLQSVTADGSRTTLVDDRSISLSGDTEHTVYAVGTVASADFFIVPADNTDTTVDFAKVQVVNATQEALTAVIYEAGRPGSGDISATTLIARSYAEPTEIATQSVQLRVERDDGSVAFDSLSFTLQNEWDVTFVITDYLGPGGSAEGVDVLRVEDSGTTVAVSTSRLPSSLRIVNALSGLDGVGVTITDTLQQSREQDVGFADGTQRELLDGGIYTMAVAPADNPGAPILDATLSVIGSFFYTLTLTGSLAAPDFFLLIDETRPVANEARVSVIHAASDLPEVDVYVSEFGADIFSGSVFRDVPFRTNRALTVADGVYSVTVTSPDSTSILVGPFPVELGDGAVETLLIHDAQEGGAPFGITIL